MEGHGEQILTADAEHGDEDHVTAPHAFHDATAPRLPTPSHEPTTAQTESCNRSTKI